MKIGIVSESPSDEAITKIIVDALTDCQNDVVSSGQQRSGGWSAAINAVATELKVLHYRFDAHALITVLDSNGSPIHDPSHQSLLFECRICRLNERVRLERSKLKKRHVPYDVDFVTGLAVPALEAWLLHGTDPHIVEARFERDLNNGVDMVAVRKELKRKLYKTETPSIVLQQTVGVAAARSICHDLSKLESAFPKGFGSFAQQIRAVAAKYP